MGEEAGGRSTLRVIARVAVVALAGLTLAGACAMIWARLRQTDTVQLLPFPRSALDYYELDEVAGHVHRPGAEVSYRWEEHPTGRIVARTNNLGFREDLPTHPDKEPGTVRVLVTGDSHIDGVVYNAESFPNVLESLIAANSTGHAVEVINGGVGHFGPRNYVGFLRKHLALAPDVYVVVLYTGNDYLDAIRDSLLHEELTMPERPADYLSRLEAASADASGAVNQSLNQVYFFKTFPSMAERARELTEQRLEEVRALCTEHGIRFVLIALPAKIDVEYATDAERLDRALVALGLSKDDFEIARRLTQDLLARFAAKGVPVVDPLPAFGTATGPLFWLEDHHLSVVGSRALAEAAVPTVEAVL